MARVISKYTSSDAITQNVEFASQKDYIEYLSKVPQQKEPGDLNRPYSFRQWFNTRDYLIAGEEYKQYTQYLEKWYQSRNRNNTTINFFTKDTYASFIDSINQSIDGRLTSSLSDIELINNAPLYADRLKNIAQYLIFKREAIKKAKLKYNLVGTNRALSRLFYEYILKAFTKNKRKNEYDVIQDAATLNTLPDLSGSQNLSITIEEIYDDTNYFDKDPTIPISTYFPRTDNTFNVLEQFNLIDQTESIEEQHKTYEWLYSTGVAQLCADNPLLWVVDDVIRQYEDGVIPLSAISDATEQVLNDYNKIALAQKYIGTNQYIISGGYYTEASSTINFNFEPGNNWFYWPSGQYSTGIDNTQFYDIDINNTSLIESGATPASSYKESDIIFVKSGSVVKAAWLQSPAINDESVSMECKINQFEIFDFNYPYPGYGLSGSDLEWTGRTLSNKDQSFYYLENDFKQAIMNRYWRDKTNPNIIIPNIKINNTKLLQSGAHAGVDIRSADVIRVKPNFDADKTSHGDTAQFAWLAKITHTMLHVSVGDNKFLWPYEKYDNTPILNDFDFSEVCAPTQISSLITPNTQIISATNPQAADIIYKLNNEGDVIESCWLSGNHFIDIATNTISTMTISAGDTIKYLRRNRSPTYTSTGTTYTSAGDFTLSIALTGWNYYSNVYDGVSPGSKPMWYDAFIDRSRQTDDKAIVSWHGNMVDNVFSGNISNISFYADLNVTYYNKGPAFIWTEPFIKRSLNYDKPQWKILDALISTPSNLITKHAQITGMQSNTPSDIILKTVPSKPLEINYFATNEFTWSQKVVDKTLGLPPTGGLWVPIISGDLVIADVPYANLPNKHYPTYASIPYIENMYTTKDSGGFMLPRNLGASTAITKNNINVFETLGYLPLTSNIFQDITKFNIDAGLTTITQNTPISTVSVDSEWMKDTFLQGVRKGIITKPDDYQEFIPYQSTYESKSINPHGITVQHDRCSQFDTYNQLLSGFESEYETVKWATDIFGFQYMLFIQDTTNISNLVIRNLKGEIKSATDEMNSIYEIIIEQYKALFKDGSKDSYDPLSINSTIKNFNVFFDTLILEFDDALAICKISIDFETGIINTSSDEVTMIKINPNMIYVDHFFIPETKQVLLSFLLQCPGITSPKIQLRPLLYQLDLDDNQLNLIYNKNSIHTDFVFSFVTIANIHSTTFTRNKNNQRFNNSFIIKQPEGMYVFSINMQARGSEYEVTDVQIITPSSP